MKRIYKKISLEQFKSRMPSTIPAYNGSDELIVFNTKSLPYTNYGMIPSNIILNSKNISYNFLVKCYHFLTEYVSLLYDSSITCAVDYYKYNSTNSKYTYEECVNMDNEYANIKISFGYSEGTAVGILYNRIKAFFPYYEIPNEFKNAWNKTKLSLSDVMYWCKWFDDRAKYASITDCSESDDCCDCEKYKALGGENILSQLKTFLRTYNNTQRITTAETYINIPIIIQNSIDDLGEFSIFCEEWEPGVSYNKNDIVLYNENVWKLTGDTSGYFSPTFKEMYFSNLSNLSYSDKESYSDTEGGLDNGITKSTDNWELSSCGSYTINSKTYSYDEHGKIVYDPIFKDITKKYKIIKEKCFLINNQLCVVEQQDYIIYNNLKIKVLYMDDAIKSNPYIIHDGKTYYANYDTNLGFYFIFDTYDYCSHDVDIPKYEINSNNVIFYGGRYHEVLESSSSITINGVSYVMADGYSNVNGTYHIYKGTRLYEDNSLGEYYAKLVIGQTAKNGRKGYTISDDTLYLYDDYQVYDLNKVSGNTESKINSFKRVDDIVCDNVGNKLDGIYHKDESIEENCWIDLPFSPNSVYDLSSTENENIYWGNLLESMEFYYLDMNGNKGSKKTITCSDIVGGKTCLDTIKELVGEINSKTMYYDIKCDITYYIGCQIISESNVYKLNDGGIKYIDTVSLIPSKGNYFIDGKNSFPINYYKMVWEKIPYVSNGEEITIDKSYFEYGIETNVDKLGFINSPIIKEEYRLRTSSLENVESDIYIQRGLSRALDNHLKLLEVKSLESLTNYGNSQFNIIKN